MGCGQMFYTAWPLWIVGFTCRNAPPSWWVPVWIALLQFALVSVKHYLLPAMPFLAMLAASSVYDDTQIRQMIEKARLR